MADDGALLPSSKPLTFNTFHPLLVILPRRDIPAPQRVEPQKIALCPFVLLISFISAWHHKEKKWEKRSMIQVMKGAKNINDF